MIINQVHLYMPADASLDSDIATIMAVLSAVTTNELHIHFDAAVELGAKLDKITALLTAQFAQGAHMAHSLDETLQEVQDTKGQTESLITLFNQVQISVNNVLSGVTLPPAVQAKVDQIFDAVKTQGDEVVAAINSGSQGAQGTQGAQGSQDQGSQGTQGSQDQGAQGTQDQGTQGAQDQGAQDAGAQGSQQPDVQPLSTRSFSTR